MEPEPSIRQTGEDALVARLLPLMPSNPSLETGPGDDCAIIRGSGNRQLLLKTDCVVEGMHFLPGTDPELIGRKALARAVSDIGAMGGTTGRGAFSGNASHRHRGNDCGNGLRPSPRLQALQLAR